MFVATIDNKKASTRLAFFAQQELLIDHIEHDRN